MLEQAIDFCRADELSKGRRRRGDTTLAQFTNIEEINQKELERIYDKEVSKIEAYYKSKVNYGNSRTVQNKCSKCGFNHNAG